MIFMTKPRIIIVEGSQGVFKTSVTRKLRDKSVYTVLLALTGVENKNEDGTKYVYAEHRSALSMIDNCKGSGLNFILDRSFMSNMVYQNLKYNNHDFESYYNSLFSHLNHIGEDYNVNFVLLTANGETFAERLNRNKPKFTDVNYNVTNSLSQQYQYEELVKDACKKYSNITFTIMPTDNRTSDDIVKEIKSL